MALWLLSIALISLLNLTIFSQGNSSVELYKSHIKPSQVSFLVGRHWLFSSLIKKIADKRSRLTVFDHKEHESKSDSTPQPSSKWKITRKAWARQNVTIGLRTFENTWPAVDNPKGSTRKIKYFILFLNFQEKPKYDWWSSCIEMWW
jgi:hypothetical protein